MKMHFAFGMVTFLLLGMNYLNHTRPAYTFESITKLAEEISQQDSQSEKQPGVPKLLADLNYDQLRDIRWKDEDTIWRREGLPFQLKFFHLGSFFQQPVRISTLSDGNEKPVVYSPGQFTFGENELKDFPVHEIPHDIGFAGFRVHYPLNNPDVMDELIVFQGASYFRALAEGNIYGLSARGAAVNTAVPGKTEEFPRFTRFWVEKPSPGAMQLTIYGLLEGKSLTGAYKFVVTPGAETHVAVEADLYIREDIGQLGIAPLTSMFWYGENCPNPNDFRPEVHDSDGLLVHDHNNEWIWRPLTNVPVQTVNTFTANQPLGFGLVQRDRDFSHYEDLEANYHRRPSLWIQPRGDWGNGKVLLMQLPTNNEYEDNVVAFWTPDQPVTKGMKLHLEYDMYWYTNSAERPDSGYVVDTRIQRPGPDDVNPDAPVRFVLEFEGSQLDSVADPAQMQAIVSARPADAVTDQQMIRNQEEGTWRVMFSLDSKVSKEPIELSCHLQNTAGETLSETWTYTWKP